ncbi:gluconokinase [Pseudochrobactrum asaccharolyticum]|uniref:gluconokinase n=1 Tax=Pseudochrobactrum asaccharolyticum TaxID=354351 RepID=UPI0040423C8B
MSKQEPVRIIVMGVSGSGKSTLASALAQVLALPFIEGDDLHPQSNIVKMQAGQPLNDADRLPWLHAISEQILALPEGAVASCSALKKSYRDLLREQTGEPLYFICLTCDPNTIAARMQARHGHFMPASLLTSQLASFEIPQGEPVTLLLSCDQPVNTMLATCKTWLEDQTGLSTITNAMPLPES